MSRCCKVCGKRLPLSGNTDGLCQEHRFEEGNVWVLNLDFYSWRPKFPPKTVRNGMKPKKVVEHE